MKTSESIVNISKALLGFQSEVGNIPKSAFNPHFKNKHATIDGILTIIDPVLTQCGLVVMQCPGYIIGTTDGSHSITLSTRIIHAESGEYIESECSFPMVKKDPQGAGACITYMRRYAISSILKLNTDDDDDGNSASNVGSKDTKKSFNTPYVPLKKEATEIEVQELGLRFMEANNLESLKNVYVSIVKDVKSKYSNADDVINKLEIMKDNIKGRYK